MNQCTCEISRTINHRPVDESRAIVEASSLGRRCWFGKQFLLALKRAWCWKGGDGVDDDKWTNRNAETVANCWSRSSKSRLEGSLKVMNESCPEWSSSILYLISSFFFYSLLIIDYYLHNWQQLSRIVYVKWKQLFEYYIQKFLGTSGISFVFFFLFLFCFCFYK